MCPSKEGAGGKRGEGGGGKEGTCGLPATRRLVAGNPMRVISYTLTAGVFGYPDRLVALGRGARVFT